MVTLDEVARVALGLPEVVEDDRRDRRAWTVGGKVIAWERAFSKADIRRYGDETPPAGPVLAVSVADVGEKEAVLAAGHAGFFTIPHFDGYAAVLIHLPDAEPDAVREAIVDGWLAVAPTKIRRSLSGESLKLLGLSD